MSERILSISINNGDSRHISALIKDYFAKGGDYIVIKNVNKLSNYTDFEIIDYYNKLNTFIGIVRKLDVGKYTDNQSDDIWVDVKYDYTSKNDKPWLSNTHLPMHTDNTLSDASNYSNLTELVCLQPSEFSGHTTLINNKLLVKLIKYVDKYENNSLFQKILDLQVNFSSNSKKESRRKIVEIVEVYDNKDESNDGSNDESNEYIFCFNSIQGLKANNDERQKSIITEFSNFLQEKIMISNLMDEIKLERGDALIFNDEKIMHGRRSVIGARHYKKCHILHEESCIFDYKKI